MDLGETDGLQANKAIEQNILVMKEQEKHEKLFELLDTLKEERNDVEPKILIFTSRKVNFMIYDDILI